MRTLFLGLLFSFCLFGQSQSLTNADIIEMIQGGLSESTIVKSIENSDRNFDTSAKGLIALKKAGATQKILDAVLASPAPTEGEKTSPRSGPSLPVHSNSDSDVVILDGTRRTILKQLVLAGMKANSSNIKWVPVGGIFAKTKASYIFEGSRAETTVSATKPQFEIRLSSNIGIAGIPTTRGKAITQ